MPATAPPVPSDLPDRSSRGAHAARDQCARRLSQREGEKGLTLGRTDQWLNATSDTTSSLVSGRSRLGGLAKLRPYSVELPRADEVLQIRTVRKMEVHMMNIEGKIRGTPYPGNKKRGNLKAAPAWSDAVIAQTRHHPKIKGPCHLKVTFRLPANKFPGDHPYGSDLDNLLKRFCDALEHTIFSEVPGGDGCVVAIRARKVRARWDHDAGADFKIVPTRAP